MSLTPREWVSADAYDHRDLPPDLTGMDWCPATWKDDEYGCTRLPGHTGRHAAGDGEHITAVWGDRS